MNVRERGSYTQGILVQVTPRRSWVLSQTLCRSRVVYKRLTYSCTYSFSSTFLLRSHPENPPVHLVWNFLTPTRTSPPRSPKRSFPLFVDSSTSPRVRSPPSHPHSPRRPTSTRAGRVLGGSLDDSDSTTRTLGTRRSSSVTYPQVQLTYWVNERVKLWCLVYRRSKSKSLGEYFQDDWSRLETSTHLDHTKFPYLKRRRGLDRLRTLPKTTETRNTWSEPEHSY